MIDTVIFDFGGVLIELMKMEEIENWLSNLNLQPSDPIAHMLLNPSKSEIFWNVMQGKVHEQDLWQQIATDWKMPLDEITESIQQITAPKKLNHKLIDFAAGLKGNYKLGILSNAGDATRELLNTRYPFDEVFDSVVISAEVGCAKPDREIYEISLERLGSKAKNAVFIDDLPENVAAAQQLGMSGIVHSENESTISTLKRLFTKEK